MESRVVTVGDMRKLLSYSEDEEPLILRLDKGKNLKNLKCVSATSAAGGRATILWFEVEVEVAKLPIVAE